MPPRPSQKRSGSNEEGLPQHASKKTRFVEPQDDPTKFAEEVDAQLEDPSARRKGRVKTEGYESDSSDDGEGVVFSRRAGVEGKDEDDDMFAMGEKEEKKVEESGKKNKEEFLRLGDIEGQEFGEPGSGGEDESESEGEPEDEDDAERRKKAGMGYELSAFNMREEMEEGKFSADGMYVRTFDPHAVHDKWMDGLDEKDIKKARRNRKHQERMQKEKERAEERELAQLGGPGEIQQAMLPLLKKGETVLEALQRMGAQAKKGSRNQRALKPNNKMKRNTDDVMDIDNPKTAHDVPSEIDRLTHLASLLMSLGDTDIYSKTYEELVRAVRKSGKVDESWEPPSADVKYEYMWDVPGSAGQQGQVFGPFREEEMHSWFKASYFGIGGEKVRVRRVGGDWGTWDDIVA